MGYAETMRRLSFTLTENVSWNKGGGNKVGGPKKGGGPTRASSPADGRNMPQRGWNDGNRWNFELAGSSSDDVEEDEEHTLRLTREVVKSATLARPWRPSGPRRPSKHPQEVAKDAPAPGRLREYFEGYRASLLY